jgi:hypothetical protein
MAVTYRLCKQSVPYKTRLTGRLIFLSERVFKTRFTENEGFGATRRTPRQFMQSHSGMSRRARVIRAFIIRKFTRVIGFVAWSARMTADYVFWPTIVLMGASSLHYRARIKTDRMAMQWGLDGKPTWSAPKKIGLWLAVAIALAMRLLIWLAMTYFPQMVHGEESGLLIASIILLASHLFVLKTAASAKPTA